MRTMKNSEQKVLCYPGDCREIMADLSPASIDSCVTDPPYELGFMGKRWDRSGVAFDPATWACVLRVLKPGAHLLAFGGTRTHHRVVCAIEDAGFEIRDIIMWVYGSGFPKSHNVPKAIDKAAGGCDPADDARLVTAAATEDAKRWAGWGTALKPAWEPIVVARKPLDGTVAENVLAHGTGALNLDGCRVPVDGVNPSVARRESAPRRQGGDALGRWPANLIHDGSEEVTELFPQQKSGDAMNVRAAGGNNKVYGKIGSKVRCYRPASEGSAARFFYCVKASRTDRSDGLPNGAANTHPTVKPTDLLRYLCRLVTPPRGAVLDPFMGSGSTGKAAILEGFSFTGCELDGDYLKIAVARMRDCLLTQEKGART